jgi:hypothetical protein
MMRGLVLLLAGCFNPTLNDCAVTCSAADPCPDGSVCASDGFCHSNSNTLCSADMPRVKYVFTTKDTFTGALFTQAQSREGCPALPGALAADCICQTVASNAQLSGRFVAWVSDSGSSATSRLHGNGPWFLPGPSAEAVVVNRPVGGTIAGALDRDESGNLLTAANTTTTFVWTGTQTDGTFAPGKTCTDWAQGGITGKSGDLTRTDLNWTQGNDRTCTDALHLFCFASD